MAFFRDRTPAFRILSAFALSGAMLSGALLAVRGHVTHATHSTVARPHVRVFASSPGSDAEPDGAVATVLPPRDAEAHSELPAWPPPLLDPTGHLRTAWDLALGRPNAREVLFTFDDGPNPGTTDRLLGMLDRAHIKAAFFVCGWRLETDEPLRSRARAILRDAFDRGHVIGNHTVHHRNLAELTREQVEYEIEHNAQLIESVIGQRPHLFRPPYGSYSEDVRRHVEAKRDELTMWSIDSHDWQRVNDAQGVAMGVIRMLGNMAGGTVLLHDTHPWSVTAAQMIFRWIENENRDRAAQNRPLYRVVDPASFIEGARARLPLIEAERAAWRAQEIAEARNARHRARDASAGDSGEGAAMAEPPTVHARSGDGGD